ncbi:MAG: YdiU family protein [Clostridia bacterium]|nr:YdiU family protein [Clostridia bacterium]
MPDKNNYDNSKANEKWNFDNSYLALPKILYTPILPTKIMSPELVLFNEDLAASLGLKSDGLNSWAGAEIFSGNRIPEGARPIAQAYAGHQFGSFTVLGDGRAVLLGEQITPKGERFDIQLKGAGITPYSRGGDGRAALGPMLREYMISEAMHHLGIPSTRSLAVVTTGEYVQRDKRLPGAVLTRVASSHIRVGTFEFLAHQGLREEVKMLADYTIKRHYPQIEHNENPYLGLLKATIESQARLIAKWQLVGFVHGVMNTDNMTISAETIDYGPCAFMETYNPDTVFSSIDYNGRYAYGNQPNIAVWNLARFAETLLHLIHNDSPTAIQSAENALKEFDPLFEMYWLEGMRKKLGIFNEEKDDKELATDLLDLMFKQSADFTNSFAALTYDIEFKGEIEKSEDFLNWYARWQERLRRQSQSRVKSLELMKASNPVIIPRNHRVEEALKAAEENNDYSLLNKLLEALNNPYTCKVEQLHYTQLPAPSDKPYVTYCGT